MIYKTGVFVLYSQGIQVLSNNNLLLCLQKFVNSSLLFNVAWLLLNNMWYFSRVHRLQIPEMGLKVWALPISFQSISKFTFLSFKSHVCKLRVVSCLYFSYFIDFLWLLSLDLNVFEVKPIYVSSEFSDLTFAW